LLPWSEAPIAALENKKDSSNAPLCIILVEQGQAVVCVSAGNKLGPYLLMAYHVL